MITTNTSTNQPQAKAIDNNHRQHYIDETSKLINTQTDYNLTKAIEKVTYIYDELTSALVLKQVGVVTRRTTSYRCGFNSLIFNNQRFMVKGKNYLVWKLMQSVNPLLHIDELGSIFTDVSKVTFVDRDYLSHVYSLIKNPTAIVDLIEDTDFVVDKIKINEPAVEDFISTTEDRIHRAVAKSLLSLSKVKGYIPMQVHESAFGRKYYRGSEYINVQQAPTVVRNALFKGCVDIDIDACSNSHLLGLAQKYNQPCKHLKQYKRFKHQWRLELTKYTFGDTSAEHVKAIKTVLTALGFGARLQEIKSSKHSNKISTYDANAFTIEQYNKFIKHPALRNYYNEIQELLPVLVEKNQKLKKLKLKKLHHNDNLKKPLKKSKVLAYLYQHFEAEAMRTALKGFEPNIRLLVHDGVYLEGISSYNILRIKQRFEQMDLTISVKQL